MTASTAETLSLEWQRNDPPCTWSQMAPWSCNRWNCKPKISQVVQCTARTPSHRGAMTRSGSDIMHFGGGSCKASIVFVITQTGPVNKWQPQFTGRWKHCVVTQLWRRISRLNPHYASWVTDLQLLVGSPTTWNNTKVIGGGELIGNGRWHCKQCAKIQLNAKQCSSSIWQKKVFSDSDVLIVNQQDTSHHGHTWEVTDHWQG